MSGTRTETRRQVTGDITSSGGEAEARSIQRRLVWSLGAAFIVILILGFFLNQWIEGGQTGMEVRSSLSFRGDGYRGLFELLRKLGFRVERQRRSYGQLPPPEESVLVIVDPLPEAVLMSEKETRVDGSLARELRSWVSRGGRVIGAPSGRIAASIFGMSIDVRPEDGAVKRFLGDQSRSILEEMLEGPFPALEWRPVEGSVSGDAELAGFSDAWRPPPARKERLAPAFLRRAGSSEILPHVAQEGEGDVEAQTFAEEEPRSFDRVAALGERTIVAAASRDAGRIWLFASAYPFTNLGLAEGGTAPLVAAVIDKATDQGQRTVFLDEYSHGLWARRGLLGWYTSTTLFYPVTAVLIVIFVLFWRGAVRTGAAREERLLPRRAKEEFVVSLADILLRAGRHRAAARSLIEAFRKRHSVWAHRVDRIEEEARKRPTFGASDLQRLAASIDEEKRRISAETNTGSIKT